MEKIYSCDRYFYSVHARMVAIAWMALRTLNRLIMKRVTMIN